MFPADEITSTLEKLGVTHIIWVPDSYIGAWEEDFERSEQLNLVRVCREGEAWPLAAGLQLGGKVPVVVIQSTGIFESGDAYRNIIFDLKVPIFAIIGARNWLTEGSKDSAKHYIRPIMDAWNFDYVMVEDESHRGRLEEHYLACQQAGKPGAVVVAEGGK